MRTVGHHCFTSIRLNFSESKLKYPSKMRLIFIALLAVVAVASAHHDISQGVRIFGDELIEQKQIDVDSKTLRVVEHTETIMAKSGFTITRVEIVDYKKKETSAIPKILSGGQHDTFVTVKFTSARGHGIHFIVKVYGKRTH